MDVKEIKEMFKNQYVDVEVYYKTGLRHFHTDCISSTENYNDNTIVVDYQLMDENEYNNSILANTSEKADFADWYDDNSTKVLCILIKQDIGE